MITTKMKDSHFAALWLAFLLSAAAAPSPASTSSPTIAYPIHVANDNGAPALVLRIGTPPQRQLVPIETASELTWFPCTSARVRPGIAFRYSRSSTFAHVPCINTDFCFNSYFVAAPFPPDSCRDNPNEPCSFLVADRPLPFASDIFNYFHSAIVDNDSSQLLVGYMSQDNFALPPPATSAAAPNPLLRRLAFGCAIQNDHERRTSPAQAVGAIGLSPGPYSFASQVLRNDAEFEDQRFAYCFLGPDRSLSASGALLLGGYELPRESLLPRDRRSLSYTKFQYARSTSLATRYYAQVAEIVVEGGEAGDEEAYVIDPSVGASVEPHRPVHLATFDSSAGVTTLPAEIYKRLVREIRRRTRGLHPRLEMEEDGTHVLCYGVDEEKVVAALPVVRVRFAGDGEGGEAAELKLEAENLLENIEVEDEVQVCLSLRSDSRVNPSGNITVIGHQLQRNHWVEFDLSARRIGIAAADCSKAL